jgi:hypothetical protein
VFGGRQPLPHWWSDPGPTGAAGQAGPEG